MRKIYMMLIAIVVVLVAANIHYYLNIYNQQINFQKNILARQTEICSWEIEHHVSDFLNEINFILFTENISLFFTNPEINISSTRKIEVFFNKYKQLITSITLYDNEKNVFSIFKDRSGSTITDTYVSREQKHLHEKEIFHELNDQSVFILPAYKDNRILANIEVRIDLSIYD